MKKATFVLVPEAGFEEEKVKEKRSYGGKGVGGITIVKNIIRSIGFNFSNSFTSFNSSSPLPPS